MSETDALIANASEYAGSFDGGELAAEPARKVAVLACMDARLDLFALLGLAAGDAHVIRNAGGAVTEDAIRSLAISQHLLGTEEVVVIRHTDCGMAKVTEDELLERLEAATGERPGWRGHAIGDLEQDLREGIERIRSSPFVAGGVRGFVFEVETGVLREVDGRDVAAR